MTFGDSASGNEQDTSSGVEPTGKATRDPVKQRVDGPLPMVARDVGVQVDFTRPGKPTENAFIESFNGRLRDECLNVEQFTSIEDAREKIQAWRIDYNQHRPHGSLGHRTPNEFTRHMLSVGTTERAAISS